jgi:histidinol-phosphate aminotransferase
MTWVASLARPEIVALKAFEPAFWEPDVARLNANELPWRASEDESAAGLNRYPDPQARALTQRLADIYRVPPESLLICRGSDEAIDLLVRAFCRAGENSVLICPPTYGLYTLAAGIQGAQVVSVPLIADKNFSLSPEAVLERCTSELKLVFLCCPNNPTGNLLDQAAILHLAEALAHRALVVVDEAYVEFSQRESLVAHLARYPQLAVLRTLSKAHGLAGARLGSLIADPEVIRLLRKIIAPYAVPQLILEAVATLLSPGHLRTLPRRIAQVRAERERLRQRLAELPNVTQVLASEANFLLARFKDPAGALKRAGEARIRVRDVRTYLSLSDALRISIGTPEQNDRLLEAWA